MKIPGVLKLKKRVETSEETGDGETSEETDAGDAVKILEVMKLKIWGLSKL